MKMKREGRDDRRLKGKANLCKPSSQKREKACIGREDIRSTKKKFKTKYETERGDNPSKTLATFHENGQ